jgi:putative alpha-1,2-mannosidase
MLHESGTGGSPKYGVIPQMPLTTLDGVNLMDNLTYMQPRIGVDLAQIGLFTTKLANGVRVDISSSMHAGLLKYTFPMSGDKYVMVDLSHYLPTQDDHIASQFYTNGFIQLNTSQSMYSGNGTWRGGWNEGLLIHNKLSISLRDTEF